MLKPASPKKSFYFFSEYLTQTIFCWWFTLSTVQLIPKFQSISSKFNFLLFLSTNRKHCSENGFQTSNRHNSKTLCPTDTKFCKINCGYNRLLIVKFHQIADILKISWIWKNIVFLGFTNFELLKFFEV